MSDRHAPDPADRDSVVVEAVGRLGAEFAGRVPDRRIRRTVVEARRDLAGVPVPALPELVERLARERLREAGGTPARRATEPAGPVPRREVRPGAPGTC